MLVIVLVLAAAAVGALPDRCPSRPRPQRPLRPIAAGKRFAGAPLPNTYGACDLLMITLPSTLTTVDLQHGYRSRGPVHGVRSCPVAGMPTLKSHPRQMPGTRKRYRPQAASSQPTRHVEACEHLRPAIDRRKSSRTATAQTATSGHNCSHHTPAWRTPHHRCGSRDDAAIGWHVALLAVSRSRRTRIVQAGPTGDVPPGGRGEVARGGALTALVRRKFAGTPVPVNRWCIAGSDRSNRAHILPTLRRKSA